MAKPDAGGDTVLCMSQLDVSARAYHRILKLARTIADLEEALHHCSKLMIIQQ